MSYKTEYEDVKNNIYLRFFHVGGIEPFEFYKKTTNTNTHKYQFYRYIDNELIHHRYLPDNFLAQIKEWDYNIDEAQKCENLYNLIIF